jgi:uncharacterized protein with HEPN domain
MDKNYKAITHINEHILSIFDYMKNIDYDDFQSNAMLYDAVVMNLSQIGEQATKLDNEFYNAHEEIPWVDIKNVRNRIIHDYDGIDKLIVWQIIEEDLPILYEEIANIQKTILKKSKNTQ